MVDKIIIKNLHLHTIIGIHEWERKHTQGVLINLAIFTNTQQAALEDNLKKSIDYSRLVDEIKALVKSTQRYTLEALAEDISHLCLQTENVSRVQVRVEKPGVVERTESVGVEIDRGKMYQA